MNRNTQCSTAKRATHPICLIFSAGPFSLAFTLGLMALLLVGACSPKESAQAPATDGDTLALSHALGFTAVKYPGYTLVHVPEPYQGATQGATYALVPKSAPLPDSLPKGITSVRTPITRLVCTSTTHLGFLEQLGATEALVGFPNTDLMTSALQWQRLEAGTLRNIGDYQGMNLEELVDLNPEAVMAFAFGGQYDYTDEMAAAGFPVVLNADYLEAHPLGRTEWIKLFGLLLGREQQADSVFNLVVHTYDSLRAKALHQNRRPGVFTGIMYGDTWYMPGGKSYVARFFQDAGAQYLWEEDSSRGSMELAFEAVYDRSSQATHWVEVGSMTTYKDLASADSRYASMPPFAKQQVWHHNKWLGPKGGNNVLELGYARPDLILADLISIFHPQLAPEGFETLFYSPLN